jgi:MFS family permease
MKTNAPVRLSIMMFLQYAIWGVWAPILALHLTGLADFRQPYHLPLFDMDLGAGTLINLVYMTMAIASMVAPVAGQIADRYVPAQYFLAFSHFVGGVLIFWLYYVESFAGIFWVLLLHCLLYAPTVGLTNSITMQNLSNSERDFGKVRLWGTVGWIVIGWAFSVWLGLTDTLIGYINPDWLRALVEFRESLPKIYKPQVGHCLLVAGGLSALLGAFCLILPNTPPSREAKNPFAFLGSFKLMANPSFAVLIFVAFLVSTELQFYYVLTPNFFNQSGGPFSEQELATALVEQSKQQVSAARYASLAPLQFPEPLTNEKALELATDLIARGDAEKNGGNGDGRLSRDELAKIDTPEAKAVLEYFDTLQKQKGGLALPQMWIMPVMTLGQIAEVLILLLVPFSLKAFGFRGTIAIGILAWSIRYWIFSLGEPRELVIASQLLHGFGFGFFFVGAFLYADKISPPDIRASVQSFIIFVTYGAGMVVSSLIAGPVRDAFKDDWHYIFMVPAGITAFCTVVFFLAFRDPPAKEESPSLSA